MIYAQAKAMRASQSDFAGKLASARSRASSERWKDPDMASLIRKIVKEHGLVGGMPMKNIHGEDIDNSVVIDSHSWAFYDPDNKCVRLLREHAISGTEIDENFSAEAFAALQNSNILEGAS
tara:strand:- start:559 stop:921 length:363 start_codon:yes stop_codon:yes gene_type:complete